MYFGSLTHIPLMDFFFKFTTGMLKGQTMSVQPMSVRMGIK